MTKKISKQLTYWLGVIAIGLVLGVSIQFVKAWSEPTVAPPGGNVGAPLNTGSNTQWKTGSLGVGVDPGNFKLRVENTDAENYFSAYFGSGRSDGWGGAMIWNPAGAELGMGDNKSWWSIYTYEGNLYFWDTADRVTIEKGGNVGIGTLNPGAKLEISDTSNSMGLNPYDGFKNVGLELVNTQTPGISGSNGTGDAAYVDFHTKSSDAINGDYGGRIWYMTNPSINGGVGGLALLGSWKNSFPASDMFISSAGNVGLGTTRPAAKLDVNGSINYDNSKMCYFAEMSGSSILISTTMAVPSSWTVKDCARTAIDACSIANKLNSNCRFELACFGSNGKHRWTKDYQASTYKDYSGNGNEGTFHWYTTADGGGIGYLSVSGAANFCGW